MDIGLEKHTTVGLAPNPKFQRNPLVELALILIITGLFVWFIILPKRAVLVAEQQQLSDLQTQDQGMSEALKSTQDLITQLHNDPDDVSLLDQALPLENNPIDFRLLLQSLAAPVGVTLGDINVSGDLESGNIASLNNPFDQTRSLQTLTATVLATGSFNQLEAFLQKLEHSGRIMDATSLNIVPSGNGNLNMAVSLKSYYFPPAPSSP